MATTHSDDGFHEIQLNGKQLVFLFMAVTVVSVVIFLCGVLVGRGVRAERGLEAAALDAAGAVAEAPAAGPAASTNTPATANEKLTYPDRLAGDRPVSEPLAGGRQPAPSPPSPPAAPAPPAASSQPPAPAPASTPAPPASSAVSPPLPSEPAGPGFAIQVTALRERTEAENLVRRLSGKGYSAYVVPPAAGTPAVYRVRVGKFKERRDAEAAAARLQQEEQFKPWIVR
jgi:cell division septation protein DedD